MFGKEDLLSGGFFALITGRKFILSACLVFLHDYPMIILLCLSIMSIAMGYYVYIKRPYDMDAANQRDFVSDLCFFIIHALTYSFIFSDEINSPNSENAGYIIISLICMILVMQLRVIFIENYLYF